MLQTALLLESELQNMVNNGNGNGNGSQNGNIAGINNATSSSQSSGSQMELILHLPDQLKIHQEKVHWIIILLLLLLMELKINIPRVNL